MTESANPRIYIGANGPPPDDPLFLDRAIIGRAIELFQFLAPDLEKILTKRSGGARVRSWRYVLGYCLADVVTRDNFAKVAGFNSKTWGEDRARPEVWRDLDDELADQLENLRMATLGYVRLKLDDLEERLEYWIGEDRDMRNVEKMQRLAELGERQALAAASAIKRAAKRRPLTPKQVLKSMSEPAIEALVLMVRSERKGARLRESAFVGREGLAECIRAGLAKDAEPHLSAATDRQVASTIMGEAVYLQAVAIASQGRKPRANPAPSAPPP